ncbi:hypothetical protein CAPTEDRAFT_178663 [Capitella teleta]|uniref:FERM domain-containing protein n=1 Tax=Capitella teleta TaxID=283909 RepID=R7TXQ2_CAPTE|nr:hypothetical protein CAPTEDRAFT_178663 [Capitella teleta]|eukprot:ELT98509.1 hypothetical protein CAPTEDRAFT_178663 [Capitella teleta]
MSEGRKSQVVLLDDRHLDILIQPKLFAHELLDLVSSHFNLKEKEYFGLAYKDETGHFHWLQLDRRVLEHELPKKSRPLQLFFSIRFYIESISYLRDRVTVELFYEQAKHSLHKGHLDCDSVTVFELAAHCLQATHGDFYDEDIARRQLKKLPVLPTSTLQEHPSITYCEDEVIVQYKKLEGQTRGGAIVSYMTIIESVPTYGIHFYEVKDKSGLPWWLGLSHKGISVYDHNDKRTPRRVFAWKQLENLYFRDKKFSIEVHDPKRVSVSRRTFGPGNVNVHAWFTCNASLTKCIWSMAVSQHQFYLDRKQSKSQLPQVRSLTEIAADLCHSNNSLNSSAPNSISRTNSSVSLTNLSLSTNNSAPHLTADDLESSSTAQRDMHSALKERRHALEEIVKKKTEQLKALCLQEASLTGSLPQETPLNPDEPLPQIRKRVGTSFSLSPEILKTSQEDAVTALELDYDIQDKIVKAAQRLSQDPTVSRSVRKQRRQSYHRAHSKVHRGLALFIIYLLYHVFCFFFSVKGHGAETTLVRSTPFVSGFYRRYGSISIC